MNNNAADQTAGMCRLVCTCVVRKPPKTSFLVLRHIYPSPVIWRPLIYCMVVCYSLYFAKEFNTVNSEMFTRVFIREILHRRNDKITQPFTDVGVLL